MTEIAVQQNPVVDKKAAPNHEEQLVTVRRLDWRFLLPSPGLGVVGYIGKRESALCQALQKFSGSVILLTDSAGAGKTGTVQRLDLLVGNSSDFMALKKATKVLRPGGCLYLELKRSRIFSNTRAVAKRLGTIGYSDVTVHWHRPNFEHCLDLVPLADSNALQHVFQRNQSNFKGKVISALGMLLQRLRLVALLTPCVSFVARKSQGEM